MLELEKWSIYCAINNWTTLALVKEGDMIDFNVLGMFYFVVIVVLHLRGIVNGQSMDVPLPVPHSIAKRMDLETCLGEKINASLPETVTHFVWSMIVFVFFLLFLAVRFDVHLNTIIRTEESRSMGAKFLDDADVSSREQCLRLCCETENCDVFVFEEKVCFFFFYENQMRYVNKSFIGSLELPNSICLIPW